ncbi:MAG: low molecular weight phosphotyrosine protein phosphatase [Flavobacteriales bacterium]|nr:low molecular weight phosphotyrosine protein phosphatase [Flavobacteriales bacterium]
MKILMVCLGNICRSPMAEGIMRHLANERNMEIKVDSCGTASYHIGETPDSRAVSTLRTHGIDISALNARQLSRTDFDKFDLIFPMDRSNLNDVLSLAPDNEAANKVRMMTDFFRPDEYIPVPDPYYGGIDGFQNVYELLIDSCNAALDHIHDTH